MKWAPINSKADIVYRAKGNIYINLTNRCSSDCVFCIARLSDKVYGYDLALEVEPEVEQVLAALELEFLSGPAAEVVFVGLGEPTMRLDAVLRITEWCHLRRISTRLVTNGHAQLINPEHDVASELAAAGLGSVSVSLVAHNPDVYNQLCRPMFTKAFREVLRFAQECIQKGIKTELTVIDIPGVDIESCRSIAARMGASCRVRQLITPESEEVKP